MSSLYNIYDHLNSNININIVFDTYNFSLNILPTTSFSSSVNYSYIIKILFYVYIISFIATCPLFSSIDVVSQSLSEDDLSSIQDLIIMVLFTVSIFLTYITFFLGFYFFKGIQVIIALSFFYIISLIFGTLVGVMFNLRYYALIFLNGSGKSRKIIYNYLLDLVSCIAFNVRICVQLIRIVLLLVTYDLCSNLYNEVLFNFEVSSLVFNNFSLISFFLLYVRILVELAHVYIIFGMQFAAFFFMVFWLVEFIFVSVTSTEKEKSLFQV